MLFAAVVGALAVAGAAAFVALRPAPAQSPPQGPSALAAPSAAALPNSALAGQATAQPAAVSMVKVRVNSEPDGASVKEDGVELCSSTPCDILYKGADADPARDHKLTLARQGYKSDTRNVRVGDSPVMVKLAKAAEVPRVQDRPAARSETPAAVPTGYKTDVPY
jgi:serine/threonine-protein kinase